MEGSKEPELFSTKVVRRKSKTKKRKFIGWGSQSLVEFLAFIGKDTSKPVSQHEVHDIIREYINKNKLIHPEKKKKVLCDAGLQSVFGRKSVNRNKIYDLLESHFAENLEQSEDDDLSYDSEEKEDDASKTCKRRRTVTSDSRTYKKEKILEAPRSCFASVTTKNIKLVYLKRSLIEDLLKNPDTFDDKVMGSFVRVKSDPNDYFQRNSHQLVQVTGIKKAAGTDDISKMVVLQVSNTRKDIYIYMLSDDDFSEEECEDLGQRIKDGLLKRLTIVELEQKAINLHENITKHWIERELALLQNLIDQANEKGWRRELFEYLERRQLLQTPSEQLKLLQEVPEVIADETELEVISQELATDEKLGNDDSSRSIPQRDSEILDGLAGNGTSSNLNVKITDTAGDGAVFYQESEKRESEGIGCAFNVTDAPVVTSDLAGDEDGNGDAIHEKAVEKEAEGIGAASTVSGADGMGLIILEDEDDDVPGDVIRDQVLNDPESDIWHYVDPFGDTQGPFSMSSLKKWKESNYFSPDFKVWKTGQTQDAAILLTDALCQVFQK